MSVRILADSGCDILDSHPHLTVLPLGIAFGEETFLDGVTLSHPDFYRRLATEKHLPSTTQVTPYAFEQAIRRTQEDDIVIITISSGTSGTYQSAVAAKEACPDRNIWVVDSQSVSLGIQVLITRALQLIDQGKNGREIFDTLEQEKQNLRVFALLDTLENLKKGGRISKTVAFAGALLHIKPIVTMKDGAVILHGKARGRQGGNRYLIEQLGAHNIDRDMPLLLGFSGEDDGLLRQFFIETEEYWRDFPHPLPTMSVGGAIGTHVGAGAIAVAFFVKEA